MMARRRRAWKGWEHPRRAAPTWPLARSVGACAQQRLRWSCCARLILRPVRRKADVLAELLISLFEVALQPALWVDGHAWAVRGGWVVCGTRSGVGCAYAAAKQPHGPTSARCMLCRFAISSQECSGASMPPTHEPSTTAAAAVAAVPPRALTEQQSRRQGARRAGSPKRLAPNGG